MSYFIFQKNKENINNSLYRIAETEIDLNNLNIIKENYKIIEDSQTNFNFVKLGLKLVDKYDNNNNISYLDITTTYNEKRLKNYILNYTSNIKLFLENNKDHIFYNKWNNYLTQLDSLNFSTITFPIISLEQYYKDLQQPSLNPLQLP